MNENHTKAHKFNATIDWFKPSRSTTEISGKAETFVVSSLYDLVDGMIRQARETGEVNVTIHLALDDETGAQTCA
jgi:hypothetical protein